MKKAIVAAVGALLLWTGSAFAAPAVQFVNTAAGMVMADTKGMVLYTWDRDMPGVSTCTGTCLTNWPLFKAAATDTPGGDWTIVTRPDNERVWAYKGKPVYYYVQDTAPMEIKGNQPTGTWHVIVQGM
jgi:predicted lipoprotein with Yx(FWY)xxD motif